MKILFYDIETAPNLAYVWGKWQQDVISYEKEREILSIAYSWGVEGPVSCLTREGEKDDKKLVKEIAQLMNEANITVAHNGDKFDRKVIKARMLYHGLPPMSMAASVDTCKAAKNYFNFNSNSLNDLCKYLQLGVKAKHSGFDLWLGCMGNAPESWKLMEKYNKQDVVLLKRLYSRLLPWIENHPNVSKVVNPASYNTAVCPSCSSLKIKKDGVRATITALKQMWRCGECGKNWTTLHTRGKV